MTLVRNISIEGFRGFRRKTMFQMGEAATVIGGPNGMGKTSFFDATVWALFGDISRLAGTRDYVGIDPVRNVFCEAQETTRVEVGFLTEEGILKVARELGSFRAFLNGRQVTASQVYSLLGLGKSDPQLSFLRSHMLSQEHIAEFVMSRPRDRYEWLKSFSGILRLEAERPFLETIGEASDIAHEELKDAEQDLQDVDSLLNQLQKDVQALRAGTPRLGFTEADISAEEESLSTEIGLSGIVEVEGPQHDNHLLASAIAKAEADLEEQQSMLAALAESFPEISTLREAQAKLVQEKRSQDERRESLRAVVEQGRVKLSELEKGLIALEEKVDTVRRQHSELHAILERLSRSIAEDRCPVCKRPIEANQLRKIISDELSSGPRIPAELQEQVRTATEAIAAQRREMSARLDEERKIARLTANIADALETNRQRLLSFDQRVARTSAIMKLKAPLSSEAITDAEAEVGRRLGMVRGWARRIRELQSRRRMLSQAELSKEKERRIRESSAQRRQVGERIKKLRKVAEILSAGKEAARDAQVATIGKVLEAYAPLIADLYDRLRPHKVFTQFGIEVTPAYKEGEVFFEASTPDGVRVRIPPYFSMAQRNSFALCVFLALNLSLGKDKTVAFVDDPIHSLDDINILALADVIKSLESYRQFVFSTHDRRVFDLLIERLRTISDSDGVKAYWFESWDRWGPQVNEVSPPKKATTPSAKEIASLIAAA